MTPSELLRVYAASGMPCAMSAESLLRLAKSLEDSEKALKDSIERYKDATRVYRRAQRWFGATILINLAMIVAWLMV